MGLPTNHNEMYRTNSPLTIPPKSHRIYLLTTRLRRRRRRAECTLLLSPRAQLAAQRIGSRQGLTDTLEILLLHRTCPVILQATAAGVVREADEGAVLIRVQRSRVGHGADTAFVFREVGFEKLGALSFGDGGVQGSATAALGAVMTEALGKNQY